MTARVDQKLSTKAPARDLTQLHEYCTREVGPVLAKTREAVNSIVETDLTALEAAVVTAQATADAAQAEVDAIQLMSYTTASASRALALTDVSKCLVASSASAIVITFPKFATTAFTAGMCGLIRWDRATVGQVSVSPEDGTVTIDSGSDEYNLLEAGSQIYWECTAASHFYIEGKKTT